MITLKELLDRVIADGIAACRESYKDKPKHRDGAVAGFEACRDKTIPELRQLLSMAHNAVGLARATDPDNYWFHRCFEAEIDWVCNIVSACLRNQGTDTIVPPTARGFLKAAEIVGVVGDRLKWIDDLSAN